MRPLNFISKILKKNLTIRKKWLDKNSIRRSRNFKPNKILHVFRSHRKQNIRTYSTRNKKLIHTDYLFLFAYAENILQLNLNFELIQFRNKKNQNYVDVYEKIVDYTEKLKQKKIIIQQTNLLQLNVTTHFFSESN